MALADILKDNLKHYDALVAEFGKVPRKGKNNPHTSVNGHMFSYLGKDGSFCLRLSKEDQADFIEKYNSKKPVSYGAVMKEYVEVPSEVLSDTKKSLEYLEKSYSYVTSLKPKFSKRKSSS